MTEEQYKKIEWFNRAFYAEKEIKALEYHKKRDKERATGIHTTYTGNSKGKSNSKSNIIEEALLTLAESDEKYENAWAKYILMRCEIEQAINNGISDPEIRAIFIYHYLDYLTFDRIAEEMNRSLSTVKRKHKKGIKKLTPNELV